MKQVNIIMSVYNGEAYLADQLDSIVSQTYKNINVYIRDDGSKDRTIEIVKEYCDRDFDGIRFYLIEDKYGNLNTWRSFFCCLMASGEADYYAYCDQDDEWEPQKVERAVKILEQQPADKSFLYASGYDVCDLELNKIGVGRRPEKLSDMNVGRAFFNYGAGLGQGFTLVFNRALKQKAFYPGKMEIRGHDVWLWAVVAGLGGGYYYDDYCSAKYRRYPGTVTPTGKGGFQLWKWRFKKFLDRELFQRVSLAVQTYAELFSEQVKSKEDKTFLQLFGNPQNAGKKRLKKAFYPYRLKPKVLEELALRFAFLCGRV